ncbi:MAG TPA: DNA alkylation repair protein [Candidatus Paceibacterota bacterium]|jgi:3-methyladenine DNA glycosylase AlkD|nr:DNA alkylation repair protein [Candidatus Paceibacterota bacterium]HJN62688.1 DNA alkylation repair protein [Candidatus Paceibacterota bacterium]|tara:strand:- start:544 stop:1227 length:684 start_codon:yes stop_codon:yes gene_type:complete
MEIKKEIRKYAKKKKAKNNEWFFKTGKGEYGEGDKFLGLTMPEQRKITLKHRELGLREVKKLLDSVYHEERMIGLLILVCKYKKTKNKKEIFDFYLKNKKAINNWDLVDVTTPNIVGDYLKNRDKGLLYKFAKSKDLWQKRIAIVATCVFIKEGNLKDTFKISEILLNDKHDLIHKAVGWMLREAGKKNQKELEKFLSKYSKVMPRTMLRYSLEKFPEIKRKKYMKK